MKKCILLFMLTLSSLVFFGCGGDDSMDSDVITEKFKVDWNGEAFSTSEVLFINIFTTDFSSISVKKDDVDLSINLANTEEGVYEIGGGDKGFTASYEFYSEKSGSIEITEKNTKKRTIKGVFDITLETSLPTQEPTIELKNGEFLVKY